MKEHRITKGVGMFLVGAMTAVAAGGYFLFGSKKASQNRKKVEGWVEDAREEVVSKTKKIKGLTQEKFDDVVDTVLDKYARAKNLTKEKMNDIREDLADRWEEVKGKVEEEEK